MWLSSLWLHVPTLKSITGHIGPLPYMPTYLMPYLCRRRPSHSRAQVQEAGRFITHHAAHLRTASSLLREVVSYVCVCGVYLWRHIWETGNLLREGLRLSCLLLPVPRARRPSRPGIVLDLDPCAPHTP